VNEQHDDGDLAADDQTDPTTKAAEPGHAAVVSHASHQENPADTAESLGTGLGDQATGDIVIDSALQDLHDAPRDDLDAQIDAGQRVHQTLQSRLSDLGGE
jgi:DNA polymerase-3 subunit gamma/tau